MSFVLTGPVCLFGRWGWRSPPLAFSSCYGLFLASCLPLSWWFVAYAIRALSYLRPTVMIEQYHDPWLDPLEPCVLCRSKIIQIGTLYTGDNSDTILLCIHKLAHIYLFAYMLSNCNFICNLYMFKNACIVSSTCQDYFSYMFPVCVVSTVILCCSDCMCHFLLALWIRSYWFIFLDLE